MHLEKNYGIRNGSKDGEAELTPSNPGRMDGIDEWMGKKQKLTCILTTASSLRSTAKHPLSDHAVVHYVYVGSNIPIAAWRRV